MKTMVRPATGGWKSILLPAFRRGGIALALGLLPLAALAQHDEDAPTPLDPATKAKQLSALGIIVVSMGAALIFYLYRRWQAAHTTNVVHGFESDQD